MLGFQRFGYHYLSLAIISTFTVLGDRTKAIPRTAVEPTPIQVSKSAFVYVPVQLPPSGEVEDILSERDIPTGDGGFARDYKIQLVAGDQLAIDLTSEAFDTVINLLNSEAKSIGKNDDGPDGTSNSLLFMRIKESGTYIIRVQGFGETSSGKFRLKVSKLKAQ
ncbi:PPC domain-containing protein [Chamaesiphon sp. OTE_20_metabat_361]|uniref:PPC domain-containing protein n=1 Tax=Chamaesiphon sp. OTE_20_metabat_361 TaxID=2964689 RepID=UPI00286AC390|nr:PPC domain-containing protein [Chamaesiphon sp. OTE_20_metabat_361]